MLERRLAPEFLGAVEDLQEASPLGGRGRGWRPRRGRPGASPPPRSAPARAARAVAASSEPSSRSGTTQVSPSRQKERLPTQSGHTTSVSEGHALERRQVGALVGRRQVHADLRAGDRVEQLGALQQAVDQLHTVPRGLQAPRQRAPERPVLDRQDRAVEVALLGRALRRQALEVEPDRDREQRPGGGAVGPQRLLELRRDADPDRAVGEELGGRLARA